MDAKQQTQINTICRTCVEAGYNLHSLEELADVGYKKTLGDLLLEIANIDVKKDNDNKLPKQLCGDCTGHLKSAYAFVQQAQKVNARLLANLQCDLYSGKYLDCLLEAPIDLPTTHVTDWLQIKIETNDYGEESSFGAVNASSKLQDEEIICNTESTPLIELKKEIGSVCGVLDKAENKMTSAQTDAVTGLKRNPIDSDHMADNSDSDDFKTNSIKSPPPKRRPGRPRKNTAYDINRSPNKEGRHTCDVCHKTFAWQKDLMRHVKSHFTQGQHKCDICDKLFIRKDKLKDHLRTHKKQTSSTSGTLERMSLHPEWRFAERLYTAQPPQHIECKLCDKKYVRVQALRQHLSLHEKMSTFDLGVDHDVVKQQFGETWTLADIKEQICVDIKQGHFAKYHAIVNDYGYELCLSDSDGLEDQEVIEKYKCELCETEFDRKYQVFVHIKDIHFAEDLPYACGVCKIGFVCKQMYKLHLRTQCRSKEKKYRCLTCPGKFMWLENLENHKCWKAVKRDNLLKCNVCNKTFMGAKTLARHKESHEADGKLHDCGICFERFLKADNLRLHIRQTHEELKRRFQCRLCGEQFEHLKELRAHLPQHADGCTGVNTQHAQFFKVYFSDEVIVQEPEIAKSIAKHYTERSLSRFYLAVDESGNELDLNDSETDEELTKSTSSLEVSAYTCDVCSTSFSKRKSILLHQHTVHNQLASTLPHACSNCGIRFVCTRLLQQHLQRDCLNTHKQLQCNKCATRFVWQENLDFHIQLKHTDPEHQINRQLSNKLHCDQCDKVFIWPKDLTRHRRIHMPDDEKYECSFCARKFNRKDNMTTHMKVHGMDTAVLAKKESQRSRVNKVQGIDENLCKRHGCKLIQCMICLSSHSKISDLRTHLRTHQYVVSFLQRSEPIEAISLQLYPEEPAMTLEALRARIIADVGAQRFDTLYSITNEFGYELSLDSSETESDSEVEDNTHTLEHMKDNVRSKYTCELCSEAFTRKYKLYAHQLSAHEWDEAPHSCVHCNTRFLSKHFLQLHYEKQCKNTRKRYVCRKCPQRFMWKENLKVHLRTRHETETDDSKKKESKRSFECIQCNRIFQMQKDLTRHMIVHRNDAFIFKCLWCPRKFYRKENLHMHIKRHGIATSQIVAAECHIKASSGANGHKVILCKVCNVQYDTVRALKAHLLQETMSELTSHQEYNSLSNYSITNELGFELQLEDSESDNDELEAQRYCCEICRLSCKRKYEMAKHQRSIHRYEKLPLKCEKCVFRTVCKDILLHHMATQCLNKAKKFQCAQCSYRFMWEENLQRHTKLLHLKEDDSNSTNITNNSTTSIFGGTSTMQQKIFPCEKCNRKYNRKDRLTAHMKKAHSESLKPIKIEEASVKKLANTTDKTQKVLTETKFLCAFCGRAVTSSSNLIIHMRRHTGEKPFKCDFCDMAFPRSSDLQCHRRKHTGEKPHKCTVCEKAFSRSYKLQIHMRVHSGERPYKCSYCEKSFAQSNDLNLHIRRHTGERPYVCGICGDRFIQGTALKNHRTMRGHYEELDPVVQMEEHF